MDGFFTALQYWHWLIVGVSFIVIEVLLPGTFFLWMGVSAGVTGLLLLALPDFDWRYQMLVFSGLSIVSIYVGRKFWRPGAIETDLPFLNRRGDQHIGRVYRLEEAVRNGRGKARVGDSLWLVSGEDMPAGTEVKVTAVEGTVLQVERTQTDEG